MGNAVFMAAEDAKGQLLALAAPLLNAKLDSLQLRDGKVWTTEGKSMPIGRILRATFGAGAAVLGQAVVAQKEILGLGILKTPNSRPFPP